MGQRNTSSAKCAWDTVNALDPHQVSLCLPRAKHVCSTYQTDPRRKRILMHMVAEPLEDLCRLEFHGAPGWLIESPVHAQTLEAKPKHQSRWITSVSVLDRSASRWHSNDYRPWRLQRFHKGSYFWLPSPCCSLNESCYITSFELVPGCFRLLRSWAGALWGRMVVAFLAVFQAILVAYFCVSPEEDIPFYSDFDLSSSTNHHLDFCDCDSETGGKQGKLQVVHCENFCPRTEW